jgi:hypothetical protein
MIPGASSMLFFSWLRLSRGFVGAGLGQCTCALGHFPFILKGRLFLFLWHINVGLVDYCGLLLLSGCAASLTGGVESQVLKFEFT